MPYAAPTPQAREVQFAAAGARWAGILASRPELQPAVALQRELLGLVANLTDVFEHGRLPRLSLPPKYLAAKLRSGVPALIGEPIPVPATLLRPTLLGLCDALERGGAGESAARIRTHIDETRMDAGSLLTASLTRDQAAIRTAAVHRGLAPDLLWLVAELAVSPFVYALQRALFGSVAPDSPLHEALDAWRHGFCPLCGSWPAVAEVVASHRHLRCSFCALAWEPGLPGCAYCGNGGDTFARLTPDEGRTDRQVEACGACRSYLKAIDVPSLTPFPFLAVSDLETMDLDMAAMEQGYARPPLKDFAARR